MTLPGGQRGIRFVAASALAIAFSAGVLTGAILAPRLTDGRSFGRSGPGVWRAAAGPAGSLGAPIFDGLRLTEPQRTAIDSVLTRRRAEVAGVWQEVQPRFQAIAGSAVTDIHGILTPQQRQLFDRRVDRRRQFIRQWMEAPPEPEPHDR